MKKVFLLVTATFILSTAYSATTMCMYCNGTGQVPQVIGVDMYLNPIYGWAICPACGGTGAIAFDPLPMPMPVTPTPVVINDGGGTTPTYENNSSNRKCSKCHGSGWYTCPCSNAPTFGIESSHTCDNCGETHTRGYHSCKCNQCGGSGYL